MIVIRINGGFGNQLFQYALALICEKRYEKQKVYLDIDDYNRNLSHTGYYISKVYSPHFEIIDEKTVKELYYGIRYNKTYYTFKKLVGNKKSDYIIDLLNGVKSHISKKRKYVITEKSYNIYDPQIFGLLDNNNYYLNGYWQNCRYFKKYEDFLQEELSLDFLTDKLLDEHKKILELSNKVSIHLRRGDYIGSRLDVCNEKYYINAISYIKRNIDNPNFIVFTDDTEYAKSFFKNEKRVRIISGNEKHCELDILLMSKCEHNIVANSTFSFWGAFLNRNKHKIVIAPQYYILDDIYKYETQFFDSWIYVNNID